MTTSPDLAAAVESGALAICATWPPIQHGQLCPVWTKKAFVGNCDCWRLPDARRDARAALDAAWPVLREQVAVELETRAAIFDSQAANGLANLQLCPDEAEELRNTAAGLRWAAHQIVRGDVPQGGA